LILWFKIEVEEHIYLFQEIYLQSQFILLLSTIYVLNHPTLNQAVHSDKSNDVESMMWNRSKSRGKLKPNSICFEPGQKVSE